MKSTRVKNIAVIGCGAAGMMAALAAARTGSKVTIFEQNEKAGKKLFITGKGRCNLTNASDMETVFENIVTNRKFLYSAFYSLDNQAVMDAFEAMRVPLKIERGNRVFPVSDKSSDVIHGLTQALQKENVQIRYRCEVKKILTQNQKVMAIRLSSQEEYLCDAVILATGGISYASTGSDGKGHKMAEMLGHKVTELRPALVPLTIQEQGAAQMQGLSLKNVSITIYNGKKKLYNGFGEMLFTHYGVSGPLILSASSLIQKELQNGELTLKIDLKPAISEVQLDERILRDFEKYKNKAFKNSLDQLLPKKMIPVILKDSGIDPDKKVNAITREERYQLVRMLKSLSFTITGTRDFSEAIVTQGGISVKEIHPATMESKLIKGLYFAGELIDVDALTGGYNLQIAWSTGWLAGISAATEDSPE